jgi:hypothetical protein
MQKVKYSSSHLEKKNAYSVVSYTHTMLVPKTPEEPCGLQLSFFLHSANVLDSNMAVILVLPLLPALAKENEKKCQTPCYICTFRSKLVFDL